MAFENYYTILGVEPKASSHVIRKAYRRLALKHHPDRNPGNALAEEQFKKVSEAYDVISDSEKRASFDLRLAAFEEALAISRHRARSPESTPAVPRKNPSKFRQDLRHMPNFDF